VLFEDFDDGSLILRVDGGRLTLNDRWPGWRAYPRRSTSSRRRTGSRRCTCAAVAGSVNVTNAHRWNIGWRRRNDQQERRLVTPG
jgi:hypothetical protein